MEEDIINKIEKAYETGRRNANNHNIYASVETKEMYNKLENNIIKYQQKMEDLVEQNTKEHSDIKEFIKMEIERVIEALNGKANKWVEDMLIWAGRIIGAGLLTLLGYLIIDYIKKSQ